MNETPSILVVDDDRNVAGLVELGLGLRFPDARVSVAHCGEQAVACHRASPADVVLLDVQLGRMNGWETMAHLRRAAATPVVVMMSGSATAQEACMRGADFFITKPFDWSTLFGLVREGLDLAWQSRAARR